MILPIPDVQTGTLIIESLLQPTIHIFVLGKMKWQVNDEWLNLPPILSREVSIILVFAMPPGLSLFVFLASRRFLKRISDILISDENRNRILFDKLEHRIHFLEVKTAAGLLNAAFIGNG